MDYFEMPCNKMMSQRQFENKWSQPQYFLNEKFITKHWIAAASSKLIWQRSMQILIPKLKIHLKVKRFKDMKEVIRNMTVHLHTIPS